MGTFRYPLQALRRQSVASSDDKAEQRAQLPGPIAKEALRMSTRILIVVDESHYGEYLGDWLSRQGHEVKTASTAHDAIDCGAAWRPHVLVADWMLKESLNGVQVSAAIREANPAVQTILITGYSSPELRARAEEAQIFRVLEKPFALEDLAGAVDKAAHESRRLHGPHLLLVSETAVVRETTVDMLHSAGWTCQATDSHAEARRAVENDAKIAVAIFDCFDPTPDLGLLASELREIRPGLPIFGSSEQLDGQQRFAQLGITEFMPRYWEVGTLMEQMVVPITHCVECGLRLPLVRTTLGASVPSWECSMCGARYRAMLRDDAPEDLRRNVRPAM